MEYIIESCPKVKKIELEAFSQISEKVNKNIYLTRKERNVFLDYYVSMARNILAQYLQVDITSDSLVNRCDLAQHIIGKLLEKNENILVFPKESQDVFYPTCKGHSFLVCILQNVPYLIDLTYRQFFLRENCLEEKFIKINDMVLKTPDPGFFVLRDNDSKEMAKKLISDGYVELNGEVAKKYGDSFYFTKTGDGHYVDISWKIYFDSLMKENYDYAVDDDRFFELYGKVM